LPKLPKIYNLFIQNKPNFQDTQMNLKFCEKMAYENKSNWTLGENKPNQTQFFRKNEYKLLCYEVL